MRARLPPRALILRSARRARLEGCSRGFGVVIGGTLGLVLHHIGWTGMPGTIAALSRPMPAEMADRAAAS